MTTSGGTFGFFTVLLAILWLPKHSADPVHLRAPRIINAEYGGSVAVSCQYDPQYRGYTKYWCRGPVYELYEVMGTCTGALLPGLEGTFSLASSLSSPTK
ncbi:CMRF35-like molecule 3 isoform X2 [Entelurus aequoreus]|uniref:CMRF35-like molecule 3 isoform X2 n=1 Tax=Entelurus aequoreus TaxID=161455 RepID=UPI002B1DD0A7|nr:CMRF35-like molecule 3 isoform X2 [Entelurus aequoreus]